MEYNSRPTMRMVCVIEHVFTKPCQQQYDHVMVSMGSSSLSNVLHRTPNNVNKKRFYPCTQMDALYVKAHLLFQYVLNNIDDLCVWKLIAMHEHRIHEYSFVCLFFVRRRGRSRMHGTYAMYACVFGVCRCTTYHCIKLTGVCACVLAVPFSGLHFRL